MTPPTRDQLINLREVEGLTREQIAEQYGVNLTKVRRWIKDLNVPRPSKQSRNKKPARLTRFGAIVIDPDDGVTILEQAKTILGDRMTEKRGRGYFLDGRPTNVARIVAAAGLRMKDDPG